MTCSERAALSETLHAPQLFRATVGQANLDRREANSGHQGELGRPFVPSEPRDRIGNDDPGNVGSSGATTPTASRPPAVASRFSVSVLLRSFAGFCDENGFSCPEEFATHQLVNLRVGPGPRDVRTVAEERHPNCQPTTQ